MVFQRDSLFYDSPLNAQGLQQGRAGPAGRAGEAALHCKCCGFTDRLGFAGVPGISASRHNIEEPCRNPSTLHSPPGSSGCREPGTCHKPVEQLQVEDIAPTSWRFHHHGATFLWILDDLDDMRSPSSWAMQVKAL